MREALRNIWRRKARSALTIFGVGIGIFALVTMGALSQSLDQSIKVATKYFENRILVSKDTGGAFGGGAFATGPQLPASVGERIEAIEGVERTYPTLAFAAVEGSEVSFTTAPEMIQGAPPADAAKDKNKLALQDGRELKAGDRGKAVIGSSIVQKKKLDVGDTAEVRGKKFEIVGTLKRTGADPDQMYFVALDDALELARDIPQLTTSNEQLVTNINVFPKPGVDSTKLTKQIEQTISGVDGTPPDQLLKTFKDASAVFSLIVLGSAVIAVLVGSLSVINTMIMSVAERRKEIGVKRVVGARAWHILRETVTETALMGLIGGILGFLGGAAVTAGVNAYTKKDGLELFLLTPDLALTAIGFAVILGILAGIYPAWRATRIKPVKVLREE